MFVAAIGYDDFLGSPAACASDGCAVAIVERYSGRRLGGTWLAWHPAAGAAGPNGAEAHGWVVPGHDPGEVLARPGCAVHAHLEAPGVS